MDHQLDPMTIAAIKWIAGAFGTTMLAVIGFGVQAMIKWLRRLAESVEGLRDDVRELASAKEHLAEKVSAVETRQEKTEEELKEFRLECAERRATGDDK